MRLGNVYGYERIGGIVTTHVQNADKQHKRKTATSRASQRQ